MRLIKYFASHSRSLSQIEVPRVFILGECSKGQHERHNGDGSKVFYESHVSFSLKWAHATRILTQRQTPDAACLLGFIKFLTHLDARAITPVAQSDRKTEVTLFHESTEKNRSSRHIFVIDLY